MNDRTPMTALSRREITKDAVEQSADAAIGAVSTITAIVFRSIREIATEIGSLGTEIFEIRDAGMRAADQVDES